MLGMKRTVEMQIEEAVCFLIRDASPPMCLACWVPEGSLQRSWGTCVLPTWTPRLPCPVLTSAQWGLWMGHCSSVQALSCWRLRPQLQPLLEYVSHFYAAPHGDLSPLMAQSGNESPCVRGSLIVEDLALPSPLPRSMPSAIHFAVAAHLAPPQPQLWESPRQVDYVRSEPPIVQNGSDWACLASLLCIHHEKRC